MEKKSNKGLSVFLIIFILISLALGGYIVYDKYFNNANEEKKTEKKEIKEEVQEEEKLNLNSSTIQKLYSSIKSNSSFDQELIEQAINKEKVLVSDLSPEILNFYGYRNLYIHQVEKDVCRNYPSIVNSSYYYCGSGIGDEDINIVDIFKEEDLKNSVENLFGPGKYQQTESFEINYAQYFVYDKDSQKYVYATLEGGGTSQEFEKELIDLKQDTDTLSLIEKISFEGKELTQISYDYKQDNNNYYLYAINLLSKQE